MNKKCKICNSSNLTIYIKQGLLPHQLYVVKCEDCGCAMLECSKNFSQDYWNTRQHEIYNNPLIIKERISLYDKYLTIIEKLNVEKEKNVLDIGCGDGLFLEIARKRGWNIEGIEISSNIQKILEKKNIKYYKDIREVSQKYELITLWDVIEHLEDPSLIFSELNSKLKDNGKVLIMTPDEDTFLRRFIVSIANFTNGKINMCNYFYYFPHWILYTHKGLNILLKRYSLYEKKYFKEHTGFFFSFYKIKTHYSKNIFSRYILKLYPILHLLLRTIKNKQVIIATKVLP